MGRCLRDGRRQRGCWRGQLDEYVVYLLLQAMTSVQKIQQQPRTDSGTTPSSVSYIRTLQRTVLYWLLLLYSLRRSSSSSCPIMHSIADQICQFYGRTSMCKFGWRHLSADPFLGRLGLAVRWLMKAIRPFRERYRQGCAPYVPPLW